MFDSSWAQFSENRGVPYYPKLQVCVPFTPVTGPRLMVRRELGPQRPAVLRALGSALLSIAGEPEGGSEGEQAGGGEARCWESGEAAGEVEARAPPVCAHK